MTLRHLTEEQAREMMNLGAIPDSLLCSAAEVAVVLTQSWCPQWRAMQKYLDRDAAPGNGSHEALIVYDLIYDRLPFFPEFLAFKESTFNNIHIPYVRYYAGGKFKGASNYIDSTGFFAMFQE